MNFTQLTQETGKRLRAGKMPKHKLTNLQVREVLEVAIQIMKETLDKAERIEIERFAVIEVHIITIKPSLSPLTGQPLPTQRIRWVIKRSSRL
jgi:nucleoid DNA-binding protein